MRTLLAAAILSAALTTVSRPPAHAVATGLPDDGPAALYRAEPTLAPARGWPGPDAFPRTSGTGRLAGGGFFWTDFLYDDHGSLGGAPGGNLAEIGVPSFGMYRYPAGAAHGNGADIFRAGILLRDDATYWRVDWTTLADPRVPIAAWTFDRSVSHSAAWPAGAGIHSPGIDTALVVSSRGARLIDLSGRGEAHLPVTVDPDSHSFVVRIPRSVLPVSGTWRIRLAAGLADGHGTGFAPAGGALPGQPAVYNVAFRTPQQEAPVNNFWNDTAQATALLSGDVSPFSVAVRWADLAARRSTPEPAPTGWSARWYVSSVDLGPGIVTDLAEEANGHPAYLGRVQPYAVYVPEHHAAAAPVTFLLHSLTQNHNQYAATTPRFTREACEARRSICISPLGRGPSGDYRGVAELDFWEVWHAAATSFGLDADHTILSGYSMGGIGSNRLAMAHPDLFARIVTLAGAVGAVPAESNLRWVPTYLAGGAADELVPITDEYAEAHMLDQLGYQYRWLVYPAEDHVAFELQDGFSDAARYMGSAARVTRPGRVTFRWTPADSDPALGIGTTGAYWIRDVVARQRTADGIIDATSAAQPDPATIPVRRASLLVPGDPTPAIASDLTWTLGPTPLPGSTVTLRVTNVAALRLLDGDDSTLDLTTDGPVAITVGATVLHFAAGHHRAALRA